jgi:hypothetical protein
MYLLQLFLPLHNNSGDRFGQQTFIDVRDDLVSRFGGITTYIRAPVRGLWQTDGYVVPDDLVIYEIVVDRLDVRWWREYKRNLEWRFEQKSLVIRAQRILLL